MEGSSSSSSGGGGGGGAVGPSSDDDFVEIRAPEHCRKPDTDDKIEAVVLTRVEPRRCGPLVQRLSTELPPLKQQSKKDERSCSSAGTADDLSHLKRVKRSAQVDDGGDEDIAQQKQQKKRKRPPADAGSTFTKSNNKKIRLDVLLGTVSALREKFKSTSNDASKSTIDDLLPFLQTYVDDAASASSSSADGNNESDKSFRQQQRQSIQLVRVPGRPGESREEWDAFNAAWPMLYFPNQTREHRERALALSGAEREQMRKGMQAAIRDAETKHSDNHDNAPGAVVVSPESGTVIATSSRERELQESPLNNSAYAGRTNPLSTSILLAIQGVSRLEREAAVSAGGLDTNAFQHGQYLCTGYDLYTTVEPSVFESMALVHARIRRVVFGCSVNRSGPNHNNPPPPPPHAPHHSRGLTEHRVHALPGTNHNYRAFRCRPDSELGVRCAQLLAMQGDKRESSEADSNS